MEDLLPFYLVAGVTYDFFMESCPNELKPFELAFKERRRLMDVDMYTMGQYVFSAVLAAVDGGLHGRKAKASYLEKPFSELAKTHAKELKGDDKVRQEKVVMNQLLEMQRRFEASKKLKEGGNPNNG